MNVRVALVLYVASVAACYAPTVPTGIACPDGACPNGQTCIAGYCDGQASDATPVDDTMEIDAPIDEAPLGAWAVPTIIPELSGSSNDWGPSISSDELTIYLNTDRFTPAEFTIYYASRATKSSTWGTLTPIPGIDLFGGDEFHAEVSLDGKELIFVSDFPPEGLRKMTRLDATQAWTGPAYVPINEKESPSLFASDLRLIVSDNNVSEYARTDASAPWSFQRNHPTLNQHRLPTVSADGLEIYTIRLDKLYRATRSDVSQPFGTPTRVSFGEPFDSYEYFDPELSADGRTMYVSIDTGSASDADIYVTTR